MKLKERERYKTKGNWRKREVKLKGRGRNATDGSWGRERRN